MTSISRVLTVGLAVWSLGGQVLAQGDQASENDRIDPQAMELANATAEYLTAQSSMSFDWFMTSDEVIEGREILTYVRSGTNVFVRDAGFKSITERDGKLRDYYYDGKTFTIAAPEEGFYSSVSFGDGFEALLDAVRERTSTQIPLWTLMSETLGQNAVTDIEGAAYMGTTLILGQEAHHLAFSEHDEDWQIWISTDPDRPVPLMIIGTDPYQQGWPQYRIQLSNWAFDVDVSEGLFTYTPDELDVAVTMPALVSSEREKAVLGAEPSGADAGTASSSSTD